MAKEIYLANGRGVALVDDEDYELVSGYRWFLHSEGYACRNVRATENEGQPRYMHRLVLGAPSFDGAKVDHINGDRLDNRRSNLRWVTPSQNNYNSRKHKDARTSRYRGVSWFAERGKWQVHIQAEGHRENLGLYDDEIEAALVYDAAAIRRHGRNARLNFPERWKEAA